MVLLTTNKTGIQEVVLDMFFELLNIDMPEWYQTFIDGRRLTSELVWTPALRCC